MKPQKSAFLSHHNHEVFFKCAFNHHLFRPFGQHINFDDMNGTVFPHYKQIGGVYVFKERPCRHLPTLNCPGHQVYVYGGP